MVRITRRLGITYDGPEPPPSEDYRRRRCVVPCDAFVEWQLQPDGRGKVKYRIERPDRDFVVLAGLWDHWEGRGETSESCTVLVTRANTRLAEIHNTKKRMPVILERDQLTECLDPDTPAERVQALMQPWRIVSCRPRRPDRMCHQLVLHPDLAR